MEAKIKELNRLKKYLREYKLFYLLGFFFSIIANVFQLYSPRILKYAIDSLQQNVQQKIQPTGEILLYYSGLIILVALGYGIFRFAARMMIIRTSRKIEYALRNEFLLHLQKQNQAYFQKIRTGDFMARATSDLNAVRLLLGPGILQPMNLVVMFSVGIGFMMAISVRLTLYLLIPVPLGVVLVYRTLHLIQKTYKEVQARFAGITAKVQENIAGMRVIKSYAQEAPEIEEFSVLNEKYIVTNILLAKIRSFLWTSMMMLLGLGNVVLLWIGGREIINKTLSIGDFVAFTAYIGILAWPIISLGWALNIYKRGIVSMNRLNDVYDAVPEIIDNDKTDYRISKISGAIQFEAVSFSYRDDLPPVLNDISFSIEPGQTVAFVGATGSGKSTIVHLIMRLFETSQGRILIDGNNVQTIPLKNLRENMGYVSQEPFLFSATIRENILFGNHSADTAAILEAATQAQIIDEINELPDKIDTMLGERGINLSGGQKQRVAIARALIRQPRILILDDALSSVDTHTEEKILSWLKNIMRERTSIIISHRISTIKNADTIFLLDNGIIKEQGNHDELIKFNGIYARLYRKQLLQESLAQAE